MAYYCCAIISHLLLCIAWLDVLLRFGRQLVENEMSRRSDERDWPRVDRKRQPENEATHTATQRERTAAVY